MHLSNALSFVNIDIIDFASTNVECVLHVKFNKWMTVVEARAATCGKARRRLRGSYRSREPVPKILLLRAPAKGPVSRERMCVESAAVKG